MSGTITLLSPLTQDEMIDLELACGKALDDWFVEHPDEDDDTGEMGAMGSIPSLEEVSKAYGDASLELPKDVEKRLAACRSAFTIDNPGDFETTGGLQVSVLRFLLQRVGKSLVLVDDYPFETSEGMLKQLESVPAVEDFGEEPAAAPKKRRAAPRIGDDGQARAERVAHSGVRHQQRESLHRREERPLPSERSLPHLRRTAARGGRHARREGGSGPRRGGCSADHLRRRAGKSAHAPVIAPHQQKKPKSALAAGDALGSELVSVVEQAAKDVERHAHGPEGSGSGEHEHHHDLVLHGR